MVFWKDFLIDLFIKYGTDKEIRLKDYCLTDAKRIFRIYRYGCLTKVKPGVYKINQQGLKVIKYWQKEKPEMMKKMKERLVEAMVKEYLEKVLGKEAVK